MPQTIARIYRNEEAATAAVNELRQRGLSADAIHAGPQPAEPGTTSESPGAPADPILESIIKAGVSRPHAEVYAERVHRGEILVVVAEPPFGFARTAISILDSHNPIEVDLPEAEPQHVAATSWNSATPLSSWVGWRVLLDDPAPLSRYLNRPVLKPEPASSQTLERIRQRSRDAAPLSAKLGMPVLSADPAPLSAKFGWRLLSEQAAPLSEKFGWRLLLHDPAPLSAKFGWRVLLDNPTPLSSRFGWKVLSKE